MDNAAIISGHSVYLPFASSSEQLIDKIKRGKRVKKSLWFASEDEAIKCGFRGNKSVAILEDVNDSPLALLYKLIDDALLQARLDVTSLAGENVRLYLTGLGPRIEGMEYKTFYNNNDIDDIKVTPSIAHLHIANMSQDRVSSNIAQHYHLRHLPPNIHSASNSSLAAVHLGCQAIERGGVELVVIVNCSKIKTQDIWFLESQSMLASRVVQPFGENSKSVLFAEGCCVMILESHRHRCARQVDEGIRLQSTYLQISAGRSNDAAWMSANILKVMNKAITDTGISVKALGGIIPHANGSSASDKAEAKAIALFAQELVIPVLAYKGQIGYTATGSGIVDLIIGEYSLRQRELLSPVGDAAITRDVAHYVLRNQGCVKHRKRHLLKMGVGIDGSIIGVVMSNMRVDG